MAHAEAVCGQRQQQAANSPRERNPGQICRVEQGDDQNSRNVIHDGQGRQEHLETEGTRAPRSAITPMAKAMSVAMAIPQPAAPGPPELIAK